MPERIVGHQDLNTYKAAFGAAMQIFELTKRFPRDEMCSLTDQIRRPSRSVCANIAGAWRKRRYEAALISKLSDVEAEAAETQTWIEFAMACHYLEPRIGQEICDTYNGIIASVVKITARIPGYCQARTDD